MPTAFEHTKVFPATLDKNPLKNITRSLMRKIGPQASQMLVGYVSGFCGPFAPLCAAAGNYEMARAFGASSSGALKTGVIAGIMTYVGSNGNVAVQALVGGIVEYAQGGNFGHGFIAVFSQCTKLKS